MVFGLAAALFAQAAAGAAEDSWEADVPASVAESTDPATPGSFGDGTLDLPPGQSLETLDLFGRPSLLRLHTSYLQAAFKRHVNTEESLAAIIELGVREGDASLRTRAESLLRTWRRLFDESADRIVAALGVVDPMFDEIEVREETRLRIAGAPIAADAARSYLLETGSIASGRQLDEWVDVLIAAAPAYDGEPLAEMREGWRYHLASEYRDRLDLVPDDGDITSGRHGTRHAPLVEFELPRSWRAINAGKRGASSPVVLSVYSMVGTGSRGVVVAVTPAVKPVGGVTVADVDATLRSVIDSFGEPVTGAREVFFDREIGGRPYRSVRSLRDLTAASDNPLRVALLMNALVIEDWIVLIAFQERRGAIDPERLPPPGRMARLLREATPAFDAMLKRVLVLPGHEGWVFERAADEPDGGG